MQAWGRGRKHRTTGFLHRASGFRFSCNALRKSCKKKNMHDAADDAAAGDDRDAAKTPKAPLATLDL